MNLNVSLVIKQETEMSQLRSLGLMRNFGIELDLELDIY